MKKQKGFTLIELMITMAIIAILVTAGIQAYANYLKNARDSARLSIASQVETAVNALMGSNGGVPPTATELIAELERMNMTTVMKSIIPQESPYLSAISDTLGNLIGAPALFGQTIKEPSGGRPICLGYDSNGIIEGGQSCAFHYIVYGDNTYVIGYGVETESNMKKNFYKVATTAVGVASGTPKYMQVKGTAQYISLPSIGEDGGPLPTITTAFGASKVAVNETTGEVTQPDVSSEIIPESSGLLSINDVVIDPCDACVNGETCVDNICITLCGSIECSANQQCVAEECKDLCGEALCSETDTCINNVCTPPNPCAGKSIGQACNGTTALYAGVSGNLNYQYMVGPTPEGGFIANWSAAGAACSAVTTYGFPGEWRLPTIEEQTRMLQPRGLITTQNWEWSSTESSASAWAGSASSGIYLHPKTFDYGRARCVRQYPCSDCSCPAGTTTCGSSCVLANTDNANCGGCGIVCSGGALCTAGVCLSPCAGKAIGQACNGTTAIYGGVYGGQNYMVGPNLEGGFAANWSAAQTVCSAVTTYGYTGEWRLPTTEEQSLMLQPRGLLVNSQNWEWSSSVAPGADNAWAGYYGSPTANNFTKTFGYGRVRCVRTF